MSEVFFSPARMKTLGIGIPFSRRDELSSESVINRIPLLLDKAGVSKTIDDGDIVAIKMTFGRIGGYRYIRPSFVRKVIDVIKSLGGRPFVTNTWGFPHLEEAMYNGFSYATLGAPIIPTNGIKENDYRVIQVSGTHLKEVKVAGNIYDADALINFAHTNFHHITGLAGLIKNLALGCTTPDTRRKRLHDRVSEEQGAKIFAETMVDIVRAVLSNKKGKVVHLSYLMDVTEHCDCPPYSTTPLIPDIGISASQEIVAAEALNIDLINKSPGSPNSLAEKYDLKPGDDKFRTINGRDAWLQVQAMEKAGLGSSSYKLIEV